MTDILTPINSRFIFDNYKIDNGVVQPLNIVEQQKFTTLAQAQAIFAMLPAGCVNPSISDNFADEFGAIEVYTNYRDNSDPSNLLCYAIECDVSVDMGTKDPSGNEVLSTMHYKFNVGEILRSRVVKGPTSILTLDKIGQLTFTLPA